MPTATTPKRQRVMAEAVFDVRLHTMVKQPPTVGCVRITSPDTEPLVKDNTISLVVVADASGSMQTGSRMENLRDGIMRLGELSSRFASMQVELTVLQFNDTVSVVWGPAPMPSETKLKELCMDIKPQGGTNIGKAIERALEIAEERVLTGRSVHVVLFTDGVDTSSLQSRMQDRTAAFLDQLKTLKRVTVHCVGICADADAVLLDVISAASCRGTFQCIKDNDIVRLMSCMWGLMMEMVDDNVRLVVETENADGTVSAVISRDVILRVGMPLVVGFKVPQQTTDLRARMIIGERCLETSIELPRVGAPAFDTVCAQEAVNQLQGELSDKIVALLRAGNPADAVLEVDITRQVVRALLDKVETDEQRAEFSAIVDAALIELEAREADMLRALDDHEESRDAELRAMSRSATVRNSGVSIVPDGFSLSALQRQLSA